MRLFFFALLSVTLVEAEVQDYRNSPLDFHRHLREAVIVGRDVEARIQAVIRETGDHSFDALLLRSPSLIAALRLEVNAWQSWSQGDYAQALSLYRNAASRLSSSKATSEAAFALYYIAEIWAEQEKHLESLNWIEQALDSVAGQDCLYLEALLWQSRAYSLWFIDHLQASIHAFSLAVERWQQIGFQAGIVTAWNNLAALYEELALWKRAGGCYQQALDLSDPALDPEIRFYLHANYALFLKKTNLRSEALRHLENARQLRSVSPVEFEILELRIRGFERPDSSLFSLNPKLPSHRIERALLLARFFDGQGNSRQARRYFQQALDLSQDSNLRHFVRRSSLEFGAWLEKSGELKGAAELYLSVLKRERNLMVPELIFPYSRAVSPLFDARLRCLIRLSREHEAWQEIQHLVELRRVKAKEISELAVPPGTEDGEKSLLLAGKLEIPGPVAPASETFLTPVPNGDELGQSLVEETGQFTVLEFWPAGNRVYAWVRDARHTAFRELFLPEDFTQMVEDVVGPLYSASTILPPPPDQGQLRRIHDCLISPLKPLIHSVNVLVVGHKEFQYLPLEMLLDEEGQYLVAQYHFSYLPSLAELRKPGFKGSVRSPVLVLPDSSLPLKQVRFEQRFLSQLFPDLIVSRRLHKRVLKNAHWVHISTHFRLNDRFWLVSDFGDETGAVNILDLLKGPFSCDLLSLGVCDAGNSYSSTSPYWLGLSELFLGQGVGALLVSRWKLDELSSRLYVNFYDLCREGVPMDRALTLARRRFLKQALVRGGRRTWGEHPFFWAGVTYVGRPEERLYVPRQGGGGVLLWILSVAAVLLSILLSLTLRWTQKK